MTLRNSSRLWTFAVPVVVGILLSGCSKGQDRAESPELGRCKSLLGAENVEAAVKATGGNDVEVSGTPQADALAAALVKEAEKWQESDLMHTSYTGCRLDAFEGDQPSGTVDVSVKWSVLSLESMDDPKAGRTWRQVNGLVYVAPEPGPARMQLVAACAVPGAAASQSTGLPLQFQVTGADLGAELRWELLRTFAQSVTEEMGCTTSPVIPSELPAAA
ncbi:hypothetical protein OG978_15850 [Streptomyces sp. NBC_01591]|uniref:hypothetical protein n=1 Tax=Streptomyces sp. NBC_01591 TaxID=2975888 RepID=UPI002DDC6E86|nr:hypothetical protein [Streptomyces sp. NBC_01591]WSD68745.1 hypothetical protein OG978_15850 [Streptomyces sp. NBC_01591]